jgi:hypothetical protein
MIQISNSTNTKLLHETEGNFLHTHMHNVIYANNCVHMRSKIYVRICTMFYQLCTYAQ